MKERNILLLVDDMEINRIILREVFRKEYRILEAENGEQALMLANNYRENIVAVLLDIIMPVKDGYQVMEEMGKQGMFSDFPVVIITADNEADSELKAFDLGASDIIGKPFEPYVVKRRVENIIELYRYKQNLEELVEEQSIKLLKSNEVMIDTLSSVIEYRSVESGQHILRIRMFTKILLEDVSRSYQEYGLDEKTIEMIVSASAMHDIGKIAVPDAILNKPGPLTTEEFEIIKTHSEKGCEILSGLGRLEDKEYQKYVYNICRYHHERWDGLGYPEGLKGDSIPICAQVVGLADVYDALTSDRVYKKALAPEQAYIMILNGECGEFSPKLLECFKNVKEQFAELSQEYADGRSPKKDFYTGELVGKKSRDEELSTLEYGQMKYFTLLRYIHAGIMELDADTGIFHLIYVPDGRFQLFNLDEKFDVAIEQFVERSVHPEDKEGMLLAFGEGLQSFFKNGLMKQQWTFRMRDSYDGEYSQWMATVLRIDVGYPHQHKVMIVWAPGKGEYEDGQNAGLQAEREDLNGIMGGLHKCRVDRWFTLVQINREFLHLVNYTEEELEEKFSNHFIELVHPMDRKALVTDVMRQMNQGNIIEAEYRMVSRNGNIIWVLDRSRVVTEDDGQEYLYCSLTDISSSKRVQEELRLSLEKHQIIMDQTNDIIFEWDILKDTLTFSANWEKKYGYQPIRERVSVEIPKASHIYPDDMPEFIRLMNAISSGTPYDEAEIRLADDKGTYKWCRVRATAQFNTSGKAIKSVGVILDIDEAKRKTQALLEKAETDSLTKLLNKNAARWKIEEYLRQEDGTERSALLIIDVDDFKLVNDRYGHMFGDAVLTEFARIIKGMFRSSDAVARIGGDEFMVYMCQVQDGRNVAARAERIIEDFKRMMYENLQIQGFSCSIGIAMYPEDGLDYKSLFMLADRALYQAKSLGKNQYAFYDKASMEDNQEEMFAANTRIESNERNECDTTDLIRCSFDILYGTTDFDQAVSSILETVGKQFEVSRVYIFEDSDDGDYMNNTYEWCGEGIEEEKGELQSMPYVNNGDNYKDNFKDKDIFYCPDVSELPKAHREILEKQNIKSLLQCAIRDGEQFKGFIGFDDCIRRRLWTQEQIDTLRFLSEMLFVFLMKWRVTQKSQEALTNLEKMLDNQNSWVYVIDPDTYEMKYVNQKMKDLIKHECIGRKCYEMTLNRNSPCDICPMRNVLEKGSTSMEFYNPIFDLWTLIDGSMITWNEKSACMLTCKDVSSYKNKTK